MSTKFELKKISNHNLYSVTYWVRLNWHDGYHEISKQMAPSQFSSPPYVIMTIIIDVLNFVFTVGSVPRLEAMIQCNTSTLIILSFNNYGMLALESLPMNR